MAIIRNGQVVTETPWYYAYSPPGRQRPQSVVLRFAPRCAFDEGRIKKRRGLTAALSFSAALTAAFAASHGRGAHADTIGCLLLVTLAGAIVGRAAYARVDQLAPPVAVSLFFFVAAGPPILRLRFVAMAATFILLVCAHAAASR
jgi:hypothetical protein